VPRLYQGHEPEKAIRTSSNVIVIFPSVGLFSPRTRTAPKAIECRAYPHGEKWSSFCTLHLSGALRPVTSVRCRRLSQPIASLIAKRSEDTPTGLRLIKARNNGLGSGGRLKRRLVVLGELLSYPKRQQDSGVTIERATNES
jgi:hypothetical protein